MNSGSGKKANELWNEPDTDTEGADQKSRGAYRDAADAERIDLAGAASALTMARNLIDRLRDRGGGRECKIRDLRRLSPFAKDSESGVAVPIAEVAGQNPDEQFAEDGGLFEGLNPPARSSVAVS